MHPLTTRDKKRFWSKVDIRGKDACWLWKAGLHHGYGWFHLVDGPKYANRIALYLVKGEYTGLALHKCNNRQCCNPRHLYAGNYMDNMWDQVQAGTNGPGELNANAKFTDEQAKLVVNMQDLGAAEVSRQLGLPRYFVEEVLQGKTYSSITGQLAGRYKKILPKGPKNIKAKLTEDQVRMIRSSKLSPKQLASKYSVHTTTINKILNRIIWSHI